MILRKILSAAGPQNHISLRRQNSAQPPLRPVDIALIGEETICCLPQPRAVADTLLQGLSNIAGLRSDRTVFQTPREFGMFASDFPLWEAQIRETFSLFPAESFPFVIDENRTVFDLAKSILTLLPRSASRASWLVSVNRFRLTQQGFGIEVLTEFSESQLKYVLRGLDFSKIWVKSGLSYAAVKIPKFPTISMQPTFFRRSGHPFVGKPEAEDFVFSQNNPNPIARAVVALGNATRTFTHGSIAVAF